MAEAFDNSEHPIHGTSDLGPAGDKGEGYTRQPIASGLPRTTSTIGSTPDGGSDVPDPLQPAPKGGSTPAPK